MLSTKYNDAVHQIKAAILQSQSKALASANQEQLALYYGIGFSHHILISGYLGQLSHYLHILDDDERIEGENPPLGIILCKDADKTFVEYVLQDYQRPMGVATYRASQERLKQLLPDEEEMKKLL